MPSLLLKTSLLLHKSYLRGKSPPVPPPAWLLRERLILVLSTSKVSACHPKRSMLGGNGYCIPMAFGMPGMVSALFSASQQASQEFPHSKSKLRAACPKVRWWWCHSVLVAVGGWEFGHATRSSPTARIGSAPEMPMLSIHVMLH
jgi:hypothetical protein